MKLNNHIHYLETDSTNTRSKTLIDTEISPFVVSADRQTLGRGRLGNTWVSDADSIYISFVLDTKHYTLEYYHYPYLSALITYLFIKRYIPHSLAIKWPNDILCGTKKVSGILIEMQKSHLVIGIGINVHQSKNYFIQHGLNGTSLSIESVEKLDVDTLRTSFIIHFQETFSFYQEKKASIFSDWTNACAHIGTQIKCRVGNRITTGIFLGLGTQGELLLETAFDKEIIHAGEIIEWT